MSRRAPRWTAAMVAMASVFSSAACEDAAVVPCRDGIGRIIDGRSWCALSADRILAHEGTVMCPLETPVPLRVGAAAICAEQPVALDDVPDEVLALLGTTACAMPLAMDDCLLASHLEGEALDNACPGSSIELVRGQARIDPGGSCGDALRGGDGADAVVIAGDVSLVEHRAITIDVDVLVADPTTGGPRNPSGAIYVQQDAEHALFLDDDGYLAAVLGTRCGDAAGAARFHRQLRDTAPFPADGRWHHVTLYADAEQRILELYFDRAFAASSEDGGVYCGPIATPSTGTGARVGGGEIDTSGFPGGFTGWLDELVVRRGAHLPIAPAPSGQCVEDAACAAASADRPLRDRGDRSCVARASCVATFACPEEAIGGTCP